MHVFTFNDCKPTSPRQVHILDASSSEITRSGSAREIICYEAITIEMIMSDARIAGTSGPFNECSGFAKDT